MVNLTGKTLFKLLLITMMVIQPVVLSYAMAGMDHSAHQVSVPVVEGHSAQHLISEAASSMQNHDDNSADTTILNDCCNSAACCPATITDVDMIPLLHNPQFSVSFYLFWEGIDLSAEIKPPRIHST